MVQLHPSRREEKLFVALVSLTWTIYDAATSQRLQRLTHLKLSITFVCSLINIFLIQMSRVLSSHSFAACPGDGV